MKQRIIPMVATGLLCLAIGALIGSCVENFLLNKRWQRALIERGHAHYHPTTGKWEWKEDEQ